MYVCICVCTCACMCVRAYVCVCVNKCIDINRLMERDKEIHLTSELEPGITLFTLRPFSTAYEDKTI